MRPPLESPIQPFHPYNEANEAVVLYEGEVGLAGLGTRPGRVELSCSPEPRVKWSIDLSPDEQDGYREAGLIDLTVRHGDRAVTIAGHCSSATEGWINGAALAWSDAPLRRMLVSWMNLPEVWGPVGLTEERRGRTSSWSGRWRAEVAGWKITLDSRPDHNEATKSAKSSRSYVLTHAMEIRRADSGDFTPDEAQQLLDHLRVVFSFAFGFWAAPVLPVGFDAEQNIVWEAWTSPICDPARRVPPGWLYRGRPEDLTELIDRALPALADPRRSGTTRLQMQSAVTAVRLSRPTGWLPIVGSRRRVVPVFTAGSLIEGGTRLCPRGIAVATPQTFTMASLRR